MEAQTIYLIRHGETDDNAKGIYQGVSRNWGLNEKGKEQARLLGRWLKTYYQKPEIVFTSPARRALETACILHFEIFGNSKLPNLNILPLFHEVNHGDWEGKSDNEVSVIYPQLYKIWQNQPMDMAFPNGETLEEARARILKLWLSNILSREEKIILVVGHGGVNFQILNHTLGSNKVRNLWQDNTCLNIIERDKTHKLRIRLINGTSHLLTETEAQ